MEFYKMLARSQSDLQRKLQQAGMMDTAETYVKKVFFNSLVLAFSIGFIGFIFVMKPAVFLISVFFTPILFLYFIKYVDVKIDKIKKEIDREIIYAGRFIIIEIESGVSLYTAIQNVEKNYEYVGKYFGDIINKVYLGTTIEDAINETMINTPSNNLRKVLWQMLNALKTGSDIGPSLNSVITQIMKEQQISVQEYGKKLNPMAMFYMMVAIILPSLGVTMIVVLATFMGLNMSLTTFMMIAAFLGFIQFMFLSLVKSARPPISY
ncbi:MAG: type II secretion system F family protein [Candidatus Nanoarchaeia archaeon]